jgi:Tfp pilus assembly protein PilE
VFSTQEFKDSISTKTALSFTLIVAGVSALVVITFLVYDCYVRRRNTKVVEAAVRSDQILMSHFPSNVRSRLYEAQQNQEKEASAEPPKSRLRHFLTGTESPAEAVDTDKSPSEVLGFEGKPIVDQYVQYNAFLFIKCPS